MLTMEAEFIEVGSHAPVRDNRNVGTVSFAGKVIGNIHIQVNEDFARIKTAAILDMELDEIDGEESIYDVIGEMSNMIGPIHRQWR